MKIIKQKDQIVWDQDSLAFSYMSAIPVGSTVRVTRSGHITEVMGSKRPFSQKGPPVKKIDRDHYLDKQTGEIKDYNHTDTRADNLNSVSRSLARGRNIINTNCTDPVRVRWCTLTYRENMTDPARLYADFKKFNQKLKRYCKKHGYPDYEYIICAEPQGRGAWHLHCLFIFADTAPFLPNTDIAEMWGQGFVNIKALDNVDNIGAYLSAYLGDLDLDAANELGLDITNMDRKTVQSGEKSKSYVKGARLKLYPPGMQIFRYSRGVKRPEVTWEPYISNRSDTDPLDSNPDDDPRGEIYKQKQKACYGEQTYRKVIDLIDDSHELPPDVEPWSNRLVYEYYKS